ncbi:MAG: PAS domain-containing protein, partial [Desulfobacterales bacterium]
MCDIDLGKITHEEARRIFNELKAENQALRNFLDMQKDQVELLTTITENMLDMVVLSDLEGNITFVGKAHETFGHEDGFLIGKNVLDFVHPEHLPYVLEEFNKLLAAGGPQTVECRFRCKDGSYMWLETVGKVINDESNNPRKIVFSAREITGRKQAEEALRQSE